MYQLLIVEDEKWEREGLRDFIDWSSFGIEVTGCARNGNEGLKMAERLRPQIIITDVKMPKMDGIQMSCNIRVFLPNTRIIILSGYDDFKYAKQSFEFQASAYILKPVQEQNLEDVLFDVLKELEYEKNKDKERDAIESQWMDYVNANRVHHLLDFLEYKTELKHIYEIAPDIRLKVSGKKVVAVLYLCFDSEKTGFYGDLHFDNKQEVMNTLCNMLYEKGIAVSYRRYPEAVICMDAPDEWHELKTELLELKEELKKRFGIEVTVGIGEVVEDLAGAPQSYAQAREAISFCFLAECGELLFYSSIKDDGCKNKDAAGGLILEANDITNKVVCNIQKGDIYKSIRLTENFLTRLRENRTIGKMLLNNFFIGIVSGLSMLLPENTNEEIYIKVLGKERPVVDFSSLGSFSQTREYLSRFLKGITAHVNDKRSSNADNIAKKVIKIIEDRYAEQLNLKRVSEEIHLSPYYIGSIFKKYTGKVFNQYLNDYRINKAKEILNSKKIKAYHLAKVVGIQNVSYFCTLFKSKIGVSPGEYRELLKGSQEDV